MHQIYQTNDSAKMCQVVKHSFLPLKKPRNSNAKSGDTGNAMIAIPDAIVPMCVQQLCRLLSNGRNSNRWQTHTSSGLFAAMRRVRAL
jgi:hypothetical protein